MRSSNIPTVLAVFGLAYALGASAFAQSLEDSVKKYQALYPLADPLQKLVNNQGKISDSIEGMDEEKLASSLKGVRNFRSVLNGFMYRGGKINPAGNDYPLPQEGLENLCKQGFGQAVYLYRKHMDEPSKSVMCMVDGKESKLTYSRLPPLGSSKNATAILKILYAGLTSSDHRPVYAHCWNGWHASGYISALALRQFCDVSADQAVAYWNLNTDHVCKGSGYENVRQAIRDFKKIDEMTLEPGVRSLVCPTATFSVNESEWCTNG